MPHVCCVIKCHNRSERDVKSYFRLPAILKRGGDRKVQLSILRQKKWLLAIRRSDLTEEQIKWSRVCGDHFKTGKPAAIEDINHPDWAPSINMGYDQDHGRKELLDDSVGSHLTEKNNQA